MRLRPILTESDLVKVKELYLQNYSSHEIIDILSLPITPRSIQRRLKKMGIIRSVRDSYNIALAKGRVGAPKKLTKIKRLKVPPTLRYQILERDNFRCKTCGATAEQRLLEVDHIDFDVRNNTPENLQTLCEYCNFGKRKIYKKYKL